MTKKHLYINAHVSLNYFFCVCEKLIFLLLNAIAHLKIMSFYRVIWHKHNNVLQVSMQITADLLCSN